MSSNRIIDLVDLDIECEKSQEYPHVLDLNRNRNWKVWRHYIESRDLNILPWCEENCQGKFISGKFTYIWKFEKIEDFVLFNLRWNEYGC